MSTCPKCGNYAKRHYCRRHGPLPHHPALVAQRERAKVEQDYLLTLESLDLNSDPTVGRP